MRREVARALAQGTRSFRDWTMGASTKIVPSASPWFAPGRGCVFLHFMIHPTLTHKFGLPLRGACCILQSFAKCFYSSSVFIKP